MIGEMLDEAQKDLDLGSTKGIHMGPRIAGGDEELS